MKGKLKVIFQLTINYQLKKLNKNKIIYLIIINIIF